MASASVPTSSFKRPRPCGNCRKRKRRCITESGQSVCVLCQFYGVEGCSFDGELPQRPVTQSRSAAGLSRSDPSTGDLRNGSAPIIADFPSTDDPPIRKVEVIEDYDTLQIPSLLKKNLGLQQHRFSRYNGPSGSLDPLLLDYCEFDDRDEYHFPNRTSIRKVSGKTSFVLRAYSRTKTRADEIDQLDQIEQLVAPHGPSLVNLYFRIVHPSFPILHKKVYLEKYARTHREFSPPCLGGVYLLALEWWNYDPVLSSQEKPNVDLLETLVRKALRDVTTRPKLSTLQGGLLLLQHRPFCDDAWALSAQMVAILQELGVHLDCGSWRVPTWEKGLRRRLAWSIYILDKWMALIHGRPSHIVDEYDWAVEPLTDNDFPENSNDEDQLEGSGEVEAGRLSYERLISLSQILDEILRTFYSLKAVKATRNVKQLLQIAKPIQIKLREWRRDLPEPLQMESTKARKTSSNGSLHLAYYAAEIALHKAIILSLNRSSCDPAIVEVCRSAARERVITATEFVRNLKPEQLQSFWAFPSGMNLVYIGIFTALLYLTSRSPEEASFYRQLLKDYRWTLRVTSRAVTFVDFAVQRLDTSLLHLEQLSPDDIINGRARSQWSMDDDDPASSFGEDEPNPQQHQGTHQNIAQLAPQNTTSTTSPTPNHQNTTPSEQQQQLFLEMLETADLNFPLSGQILRGEMVPGPDFFGRDWNQSASPDALRALDLSPS